MNLAVITTIGVNAGDNFIYEGFKSLFPSKHYGSVFLIDKTSIPKDDSYKELIDRSEILVICGSPIFYQGCYKMKWQNKILEYSKKSKKKILLFAVGSNFRCSADGTVIFPDTDKDNNYLNFVSRYNEVLLGDFLVRDGYARRFLEGLGISNIRQVVCPSLFASDVSQYLDERDLIFIIWGSKHWNCDLPPERVLRICEEVKRALSSLFLDKKIIWVCHDFDSYKELLKRAFDKDDVLFSNNYMDFFKYYSRCYFAFSVKVHGSMLLASMGIPSVLLQLDSRAGIISALDEDYATPSAPIDRLIDMCVRKVEDIDKYKDKIAKLKSRYRADYEEIFKGLGFV